MIHPCLWSPIRVGISLLQIWADLNFHQSHLNPTSSESMHIQINPNKFIIINTRKHKSQHVKRSHLSINQNTTNQPLHKSYQLLHKWYIHSKINQTTPINHIIVMIYMILSRSTNDDHKIVIDDRKMKRKDRRWSTLRGEASLMEISTWKHHRILKLM